MTHLVTHFLFGWAVFLLGVRREFRKCFIELGLTNAGDGIVDAKEFLRSAIGCVDPTADLGQACQNAGDCTLGQCVDGVCCDSPCAGTCERCSAPGDEGRCVADSPETACDAQAPARRCLARGLCQLPNGQTCSANEDCGSGRCEAGLGGVSVCCAVSCQPGVQACNAAGTACQVVPRSNGSACATDDQCISGSCDQQRCCPADCGGACEVCSLRGQCEVPPANASTGCAAINCAAQNTTCRTFGNIGNLCEAVGDCKEAADCPFTNVAQGTACTLGSGAGGRCNGSGACEAIPQSEICGAVPLPARVRSLAPVRGAFTGSMRAPAARQTRRPLFVWSSSSTQCPAGPVSYQLQLDNGCQPGALAGCSFSSPELDTTTAQTQFRPATDLPVATQAPVGAFYGWRVRACDPAARCSEWSDVAYLHVGRTPQDLNGDGFADVIAGTNTVDLYLGGAQFDARPEQQFALSTSAIFRSRFVGDLNGDGFGDVGIVESNFQVCGSSGPYPVVVFGGSDPSALERQVFCSVAGSPSVQFQVGHVGDLNGDGFDDLGFARELSGQGDAFRVLLGGSAVSSTAEIDLDISIASETAGSTVSYPHTATTDRTFDGGGDFNGDGFADVVLSGDGRRATGLIRQRLFLGGATLSRSFAGSFDATGCFNAWVTRLGDVTADGRDDWGILCNISGGGSRFGVVRGGNALGTTLTDSFASTASLRAASNGLDFDGDGTLDVFILQQTGAAFLWRRGNFNPAAPTTINQLRGGTLIATADHNGDGRPDLVTWESGIAPSWAAAGASLNVSPITLMPFSGSAAPASIVF